MRDKEIQSLIDKYLEGITSPDEEKQLAAELLREDIPKEWEPIRLMLGELAMGEALYDRMMAERQSQQPATSCHKQWRWAALTAVAASLAFILMLAWPQEKTDNNPVSQVDKTPMIVVENSEDEHAPTTDTLSKMADAHQVPEVEVDTKAKVVGAAKSPQSSRPAKMPSEVQSQALMSNNTLYEDTLGSGIWKDEKNIIIAQEILNDCERTIIQSKKTIRNGVVEASFNALPQRPNIQLVIDEDGNYVVTDDAQPSIIAL